GRWSRSESDPLDKLLEESRPSWQRHLLRFARPVGRIYLAAILVWLSAAPLVASHYHLVSPVAMLLGPVLMVLTAMALLSGFHLLLAAVCYWPLVPFWAWLTRWSLAGSDFLVRLGERLPGGHVYVADVPPWWLWIFYTGLLAYLTLEPLRQRWRWMLAGGLAWLCLGLASGWARPTPEELRCTFLAVGHGGCAVIETPDGRVLLYDAGALGGPDVTRRQIAPFLWNRGIHRIDEVFLSHADLDHFNGLVPLLDRFAIGQVSCTPTFRDKAEVGVHVTLATLQEHQIPVRIIRAGDRLSTSAFTIEVLHPPAAGPEGNENTRSLVLLLRHAGHALLLTGDLEGLGLQRVVDLRPAHVDVLQAPHHGSRAGPREELAGRTELVAQTQPSFIISCQGSPTWPPRGPDPYARQGVQFLGTWPHGAITIHSSSRGLVVETFQTGQRWVVPSARIRESD
ncbi:MAG: ComEC/Rec2 family competence protein, partial [Planctomycetes bacterium]|nr:ComEC/Rec2 family competence protein [Planctomycetota bacterium]